MLIVVEAGGQEMAWVEPEKVVMVVERVLEDFLDVLGVLVV